MKPIYYMRNFNLEEPFMKEFNSFENYLKSLGKCEFLTAEEELSCLKKAKNGDRLAFDRITKANLRFVVTQAKKYAGYGVDIEDLVSAGNLGLVKAVEKFDSSRKVRFITCAIYWIRAEMIEELERSRAISIPHNYETLEREIRKMELELPAKMSTAERTAVIASHFGVKKSTVQSLMNARSPYSLDECMSDDDEGWNLYSQVESSCRDPYEEFVVRDAKEKIRKIIFDMPPEERRVFVKHYGLFGAEKESLQTIADNWGSKITREGIRQKELKARKFLVEAGKSMDLEEYAGVAV